MQRIKSTIVCRGRRYEGFLRVYLQINGRPLILYVFEGQEHESAIRFEIKSFFAVSTQKNYRHLAFFHRH